MAILLSQINPIIFMISETRSSGLGVPAFSSRNAWSRSNSVSQQFQLSLRTEPLFMEPVLKTVFRVMMRLFSPRKTTMLFVIRDKTQTPLENFEPVLREDIQKIWDSVPKPEAHKETPLSDFFNVEVVALSSYEEKEEQFKEQVCVCERPGLLQMPDTYCRLIP